MNLLCTESRETGVIKKYILETGFLLLEVHAQIIGTRTEELRLSLSLIAKPLFE